MDNFTYFIESPILKTNKTLIFYEKMQQLWYNSDESDDEPIGVETCPMFTTLELS
jgi:hypothetical protein